MTGTKPTLTSKDVSDEAFAKWLRDSPLHLRGDFAAFHAGFAAGRGSHETCDARDAARYRWLREHAQHGVRITYKDEDDMERSTEWQQIPRALDESVDSAIERSSQKASEPRGESRAEFERDRGFVRRCPKCNRDVSSGCNYCACPYPQSPAVSEGV